MDMLISSIALLLAAVTVSGVLGQDVIWPHETYIMPSGEFCQNIWWTGVRGHRVLSQTGATYLENLRCDVTIGIAGDRQDEGIKYGIKIYFTQFDVEEPTNGSCLDYLQFFYDHQRRLPITDKLCGSTTPDNLEILENQFTFYFYSDGRFQGAGFRFNYTEFILPGQLPNVTSPTPDPRTSSGIMTSSAIRLCVMAALFIMGLNQRFSSWE